MRKPVASPSLMAKKRTSDNNKISVLHTKHIFALLHSLVSFCLKQCNTHTHTNTLIRFTQTCVTHAPDYTIFTTKKNVKKKHTFLA